MAVDQANVRADLVQVKLGANEYLEAKVSSTFGGKKIPIAPARNGEEVGYIQGSRNEDITVEFIETSPAVMRAILGFDNAGQDSFPAVGSAGVYTTLEIKDPTDGAGLGKRLYTRVGLLSASMEEDGDGLKTIKCVYRAYCDGNGDVWKIGT